MLFLIDENYVGNVSYNKLLRSTNYGTSWDSVFAPPTGISIGTLLFKDDSVVAFLKAVKAFLFFLNSVKLIFLIANCLLEF